MTMEEIKLWVVEGSKAVVEVPGADRTESERMLEDTLVANPNLLMPRLTLVGRQTQTEGGPLDLLGVDEEGRLVVFELKRGNLSRDAVTQVIDYASSLADMNDSDLAQHISARSGGRGVEKIDDFEEWYANRAEEQSWSGWRPVRMVLVGLGVDGPTNRMVRFLADKGVEITLLTFHGYDYEGRTLLARQVRVETGSGQTRRRLGREEARQRLDKRVEEQTEQWPEGQDLWDAVLGMFRASLQGASELPSTSTRVGTPNPNWNEWPLYRLNFRLPKQRSFFAAIQLAPWSKVVEVIFFQPAVKLCLDDFTKLRKEIPEFYTWPEDHPARDDGVIEIKFPLGSPAKWEQHKRKLASVARSVYEAAMGGDAE